MGRATAATQLWEILDEDKQKHQAALSRAQEMKGQARHTNCLVWQNLIRGTDKANAFSKLSRYETAIERSLYKALHELQRLYKPPELPEVAFRPLQR